MPLILDVNSVPDAELSAGIDKVNRILDENMSFLVNSYMIPELRAVAMSSNLPDGFVIGIKFVKTGDNEGKIINTWGREDLPLALWFNYGTSDHGALGNWPLHWRDKDTGEEIYAMYVRGVPKTLAMEIGMEIGTKRLREEVPRFIERQLQ